MRCHPLTNASADWKNALLRAAVASSARVSLLPMAEALRSQYDAHLEATSKLTKFAAADCTHWCFPSAPLHYASTIFQNALL
jgi:hypothetical protein